MKETNKLAILIITLLFLNGCTPARVVPKETLNSSPMLLDIDKSIIVHQQPARFANANLGKRFADFQLGVYTQTKTDIILFSYSEDSKTFHKVLVIPLDKIDKVAIETWGMFKGFNQLQITVGSNVIAVNFHNDSQAISGSTENTMPPYNALISAGVKGGSPYSKIIPNEYRDDVLLPIFIPVN